MSQNDGWRKDGLRFECQQSGKCCTSHGEYGYVYLTKDDRKKMSEHLGLKIDTFTKKYCDKTDGIFHLKDNDGNPDCLFLKNKKCTVYEARPTQCRTWPFWPENMNAKTWNKDIASFCPGVGKGPIRDISDINRQVAEQDKANHEYGN